MLKMEMLHVFGFLYLLTKTVKGQSLEASTNSYTGELKGSITVKWRVTKHEKSDIIEKAILFFGKKSTGEVLFHGTMNPISKRPAAHRIFGVRIHAYWDGLDYKVELKNLQYNDTVSLTLLVTQTLSNRLEQRGHPMLKTITITRVYGGPNFCHHDIPKRYAFNEFTLKKIKIILCGVPAPMVKWKFDDRTFENAWPTPINNYTFRYSIQLPNLTQKMCGGELIIYATSKHKKIRILRNSSVFLKSFKPAPIHINGFLLSEKNGCKRYLQWHLLDTGKCPVQYNIQFINSCGRILANVTAINHNVSLYCADVYTDANSVTMWATYNSVKGNESHAELFLTTPKLPITVMPSNRGLVYLPKSGKSRDIDIGIGIGTGTGFWILVFLIYKAVSISCSRETVTEKHASRNEDNTSKDQNPQYEEIENVVLEECRSFNIQQTDNRNRAEEKKKKENTSPQEASQNLESNIPKSCVLLPKYAHEIGHEKTEVVYVNQQPVEISQSDDKPSSYAALQHMGWCKDSYQKLKR